MSFKPVTSAANPIVKRLASLRQKKYRLAEGLFLLEGLRHVDEALAAGWKPAVIAVRDGLDLPPAMVQRLADIKCEKLSLPHALLQKISDRDNAEDVVAAFAPVFGPAPTGAQSARKNKRPVWILLEQLRDPGNLGTIMRTAHAANAAGVILLGDTCDPWSPEAVRASMGSCLHISLTQMTDREFDGWRKKFAGAVIGTHVAAGSRDFRKMSYQTPLVIALGSEQNGLSEKTIKACTDIVHIPMPGGTESLNVGVAAALMIYEAVR
jgi:TrmH family RNA methyltransferase